MSVSAPSIGGRVSSAVVGGASLLLTPACCSVPECTWCLPGCKKEESARDVVQTRSSLGQPLPRQPMDRSWSSWSGFCGWPWDICCSLTIDTSGFWSHGLSLIPLRVVQVLIIYSQETPDWGCLAVGCYLPLSRLVL